MTIFGWDMSHFDSPGIGSAVAEGIEFITHKAGGDQDDPEISAWWSGVRTLGQDVLLGAYWVLLPGSPEARADRFLDRLDGQCPGWRGRPFMLQVDCERWNGDPNTVPSKAEIKAFCDRLVQRVPTLRPIVYAPKWVYGDSLSGLGYPLWASSYVTASGFFRTIYPGDGSSHWADYSGQTPAILQYSSSATIGGQTFSDANAYRGTLAQLKALVAPGWSANVATLDAEDIANIKAAVWGSDIDPSDGGYTAGGALWTVLGRTNALTGAAGVPTVLASVLAQSQSNGSGISALSSRQQVTAQDVAAALVQPLAAAVLAGLPAGTLTVEQVTEAVVNGTKSVLRQATV